MKKKPVIGLTSDLVDDKKYSHMPYLALRENYSESLLANGATPILLPPIHSKAEEYLEMLDGLVITGGNFDIPPVLYGAEKMHEQVSINMTRTDFENQITRLAIKRKLPILGICGGMQLLNVIYGGDLIQHLPDVINNSQMHEHKPYTNEAHKIVIEEDSLLYKLAGQKTIGVNSSHHQAINRVGNGLTIVASARDGVIEAFENQSYPSFMMGVQWHPEYNVTHLDQNIFIELIKASENFSNKKKNILSRFFCKKSAHK